MTGKSVPPTGNNKKVKCLINKLRQFKAPLVPSESFPSRVSINKEYKSTSGEFGEFGFSENDLFSSLKYKQEKSPITYWRRAEYSDVHSVTELIEKSNYDLSNLFGESDVPNLIEKSNFALVQFNSKKEIVSFTSIFSYPNIPAVPSFDWYTWLMRLYRLTEINPRNSCFIHYMTWDNEYYHDFLKLTLQTTFLENGYLNNIIITKPPKSKLPSILTKYFVQILPFDAGKYTCDCNSLQTILLCTRQSLLEPLKIRLAIVEDHDDLMPIAEQHTERLRELYGDYSMAEIIEYPGTNERKTLVCESNGYAIGFMNINKAVDFELLNSQFDLAVFHGLRKVAPGDKDVTAEFENYKENQLSLPERMDPFLEIIDKEDMLRFLNWEPSLCASKEDLSQSESGSESENKGYNLLSKSMSNLVKETLNLSLAPKFSAHALSLTEGDSESSSSTGSTAFQGYSGSSVGEEYNVTSESSLISLQHYNLPTYTGAPNAFLIEFFAIDKNFDERLCHSFLEAAFEEFPELEYCLLTLPSQTPNFPLLDFFTRVTPRPLKRFRQELYVCHKSCVMISYMRVRRIMKPDLDEIQSLLIGIKNQQYIFNDVTSSCYYEDSAYQGFVLTCSKSIIGVAVLCNEYGMEYLANRYKVADLIDFDLHKLDFHAILKHLVLSPIFQPHARFFLRDVMRMADVTCLYRARYEESESNWNKSSLITVLGQLVPVKPRKMVKYHLPSLEPNIPPDFFTRQEIPFSLYHINSRVCGLRKFTCNINVIVVGSSTTAYSFLENLLFSLSAPFVTYHNITWVSPHGMGTEIPSHAARDIIFPVEGKYSRFYKMQLCLKTYVHFVYGVMTDINRTEKYITINKDAIIPYDYLILLCGRQFVIPTPLTLINDPKECRRNFRPRCTLFKYLLTQKTKEEIDKTVYPANVFLVNTEVDATNAFISLQYLIQLKKIFEENEKIIIYGHHICVYLCTQALLEYGVDPRSIALVEPFPSKTHGVSCLKDPNVDEAVINNLKNLGIDHYLGYVLYDWSFCSNKNQIRSATFHSEHKKVTINCLAMFPFHDKQVSEVTFKAVNEASLVYDGKLVINSNFQTNDQYIYAAGGMTKYQRKYYSKNKKHYYYNSSEIGSYLADIIRLKIDPTAEPTTEEIPELVPEMMKPLTTFGILPGGWKYLHIRKPGKFVDPETKAGLKDFGDQITTGDCEMSRGYGYFKLLLDDYGFVSEIVCYTKDDIDIENLVMLYGKHEALLNNLLLRFDLGMIKDLYSYFREPWVYAIYHDRFNIVLNKNTELFYEEELVDMVINTLKEYNWQRPPTEKIMEIKEAFEHSGLKPKIAENIMNFLWYFDEPFPMYATPRILRVLLHNSEKSLLHAPYKNKIT